MKSGSDLTSDFWWLPRNIGIEDLSVSLGHHTALTDKDDPCSMQWFHSLDENMQISPEAKYYDLDVLSKWRSVCKNTNVYRTIKVFDKKTGEPLFLGPFLIDIDNSVENNGFREDLDDAQAVTKQVVTYLIQQLELFSDDLRIFFSGRKGFNVEIRPQALGINGSLLDQVRLSSKKLDDIISALRNSNNIQGSSRNVVGRQGTIIDRIYGDRFGYKLKHPCVRLHDSINKWIRGDGKAVARRKIEITLEQLRNMSAAEISLKSERLALIP